MEDKQQRRALVREYRERPVTGGVYSITNRENGKVFVAWGIDLTALLNRFRFSVSTNNCVYAKLKEDWQAFGCKAFEFAVLEELEKKPEQDIKDFRSDLAVLEELWREKLSEQNLY